MGPTTVRVTQRVWSLDMAGRMLAEEARRLTALPRRASTGRVLGAGWQALTVYAHGGRALAAASGELAELWVDAGFGPSVAVRQMLRAPSLPASGKDLRIDGRPACPAAPAWLCLPDAPSGADPCEVMRWDRDLMCVLGVTVGHVLLRQSRQAADPVDADVCDRAGAVVGVSGGLWERAEGQVARLLGQLHAKSPLFD